MALEVVLVSSLFVLLFAGVVEVGFGLPGEVKDRALRLWMLRLFGHVGASRGCCVNYETVLGIGIFRLCGPQTLAWIAA